VNRDVRNAQQMRRDEWIPFLAQFTRENRGAKARLEVIQPGSEFGDAVETENRPFEGISADTRDQESTVWITLGPDPDNHLSHGVGRATAIYSLAPTEFTGPALVIESADRSRTILELTKAGSFELPGGGTRNRV
jgi:hypothetical protein